MRTIIITLMLAGFCIKYNSLLAQSACPEAPDYGYWHFELDTAGNDITSKDYWIHYTTGPVDFIRSPFYDSGHNPILPLQDPGPAKKDNKPEDGWEVMYHDFGWSKLDTGFQSKSVQHPLLILYNKYNGTLRVMINIFQPFQGEDIMAINIQFHDRGNNKWSESALLSHASSRTYAVDRFEKNVLMSSVTENVYVTQDPKRWYFADFPMAYDPCTCTEDTRLRFTIRMIDNASIQLKGNGTVIDSIGSSSKTEPDGEKSVLNAAKGAIESGVKAYSEGEKMKSKAEDVIDKLKYDDDDNSAAANLKRSLALNSVAEIAKGLTKGIPIANAAIGIFDFLMTGGKKTEVSPTPKVSHINMTYTGTISFTNIYRDVSFVNPNSLKADTAAALSDWENLPKTKYTLGICNLLETPVLEWMPIYTNNIMWTPDYYTHQRQYKVRDPLKFVVNPSLDLELVELNAAVLIEYPVGTVIDPSFPAFFTLPADNLYKELPERDTMPVFERLAQVGLEVEAWPKAYPTEFNPSIDSFIVTEEHGPVVLRTPYYNAACFEKATFMIHDTLGPATALYYPQGVKPPNFYCKIQTRFRRTDSLADDSTKDVLYIATYNVEVLEKVDTTNVYYYTDYSPPTSSDVFKQYFKDTVGTPVNVKLFQYETPWELPWSDYYPGLQRVLKLNASIGSDTTIYARDTVYLEANFVASAGSLDQVLVQAGDAIVVESDNWSSNYSRSRHPRLGHFGNYAGGARRPITASAWPSRSIRPWPPKPTCRISAIRRSTTLKHRQTTRATA